MNTQHTPGIRETEYSKEWMRKNPALFTSSILDFVEQHPSPYWVLSMTTTKGFFTMRAAIAKATGSAS